MSIDLLEDGKIYKVAKCQRCSYTAFMEHMGTQGLDGGFTKIEKFGELPEGWQKRIGIGMLCPKCNSLFERMKKDFMQLK